MNVNALLKKDLLWGEAEDVGDVTEVALLETMNVITAASHKVPVSKSGYVEFLGSSATEV